MAGLNPATVLVIDDDRDVLTVLRAHLEGAGYHVKAASDGVAGLRLARDGVDLITLDLLMAPLDGPTMLRRLRADPRTCDIPVMLVTVVDDIPEELAAEGRVRKPFCGARLIAEVHRLLGR
jgi:CheY-like chemotaxis protein